MSFFTFITRNLLRRRTRSFLTVVGLAVAVAAVVSLVGVATSFERSFIGMYNQRGIDLVVQKAGRNNLNNDLPADLQGLLEKVPGVKQVLGGSVDIISFPEAQLFQVPINGWPVGSDLYKRVKVVQGRQLEAGDKNKAMLGRELAANLQVKAGDEIPLYGQQFQVAGIFESGVIFENGAVIVTLDEFQRLTGRENQITGFTIQVNKPIDDAKLEEIRQQIESLMPGVPIRAKTPTDFVQSIDEIRMARAMAWIISAIALFIGAIGMLNTMVMSVFERTREIGTLRAIGWKKSRIASMVIGEALLLSIGGAVAGSLAGLVLTKFLSTLKNAAGFMSGDVPPLVIAQGCLVAILVGVAGAIYPALWSANLLPTEALRRK